MKFSLLLYVSPEGFEARAQPNQEEYMAAWGSYMRALRESGTLVGGEPFSVPSAASTVRVSDAGTHVQDGPFADTKEQLGGVLILETPDMESALGWAGRCPTSRISTIEVRPIWTMG